jgi:hypothetical protein
VGLDFLAVDGDVEEGEEEEDEEGVEGEEDECRLLMSGLDLLSPETSDLADSSFSLPQQLEDEVSPTDCRAVS